MSVQFLCPVVNGADSEKDSSVRTHARICTRSKSTKEVKNEGRWLSLNPDSCLREIQINLWQKRIVLDNVSARDSDLEYYLEFK